MNHAEYKIRSLAETDRSDVLEIASLTFEGHDHLPKMFDEWLIDTNCFPYAIEVSNKVISLGNVRLIENGRTAWLEGLRVHPEYRTKGFAHLMTRRLLDAAKEIGASRTRLTVSLDNPIPIVLAKSIGMHQVFSFEVGWKWQLAEIKLEHDVTHVQQVTGTEMLQMITSNESILPSSIFVYYWYALDANEENVASLDKDVIFWVLKEDDRTTGLAVGTLKETKNDPEWWTTIYATTENAFKTLLTHQIQTTMVKNLDTIVFQYSKEYDQLVKELIGEKDYKGTSALFEGPV